MPHIHQTIALMMKAHDGQIDKRGLPYWYHPYRVALRLDLYSDSKSYYNPLIEAALLHDVVEDTNITIGQLQILGYSETTLETIGLLTKNRSLTYAQNIERIVDSGNPFAIFVKLADNYDNSCSSRIDHLVEDERESLTKRYAKARKSLESAAEELLMDACISIRKGDVRLSPLDEFLLT